jgi:ABC-type branched-subunit amino acid transport system ATPase component/MFS family permease
MIPVLASSDRPWPQRFAVAVRHPVRWLDQLCGDGPLYALVILFGLNAVDELDRTAFVILSPNIAEHFGVGLGGIFTVVALAGVVALGLTVPIAYLADRLSRVKLALVGGVVMAVFAFGIGLSLNVFMFGVMLTGAQLGKSVIDPTHNSLLADYYPIELRPRIYSFHRSANAVGQFVGPLSAGFLAYYFGWRTPFFVFAVPTLIFVILGLRLREPIRGRRERLAMGASDEAAVTEEEPPSFAEAWRMCWKIDSLRRIYRSLPFLAPALIGFVALAAFLYADVFGLDERDRGVIGSITEPAQLAGLMVGGRIGMKLFAKDPKLVFKMLSSVSLLVGGLSVVFALSPHVTVGAFGIRLPLVAVLANMAISACLAFLLPGVLAALSLAIPPRARSMGFSMGSVFVIPGLLILPVIGWIGDTWGVRQGLLAMVPMFVIGSFAIGSAGKLLQRDITNVWTTAAARSEVAYERRQGRSKLLLVRDLDVAYGDVQVLFGIDFEVDEGEIVALLGTNGAGKSTLLKAISGVVEADKGAVIFDGADITHAPPNEIAPRGVIQIPGGEGVFPSLTVAENLRMAGWMNRRDRKGVAAAVERVYGELPVLAERAAEPAANLSGGQQQMLALGMAFITKPRLLMIDELSLGLAPALIERLLPMVRRLSEGGTTIILVEQSVNVALTLAEEAYFMEKGEIRFHGPTTELLDRPDVLRSVFLEGVDSGIRTAGGATRAAAPDDGADNHGDHQAPSPVAVAERLDGNDGAAETPALEVIEVSRRFGGIRAVDDVSLTVMPGEIVGVIGPNGAGKTTLFDVISGYTPADAGRLILDGRRDITTLAPEARATAGLGRSFQDARLFPGVTVEDTIKVALDRWTQVRDPLLAALRLPAAFDSEDQVQRRVDELIDLLGLDAFRNKFVRELSTGSRRIVDLACIVAHRPSVVLLDEPSSGIAQRETEALGPVILRIREQLGASVLVIEHDMPLVSTISDRMVALDQGRVVTEGHPRDVLHHPEVVAAYLGTSDAVVARSGARVGSESGPDV